jgi:hypothetical protein
MKLIVTGSEWQWPPGSGAVGYDIVRGNLGTLRTSHGDFSTSTELCLGDNVTSTTFTDTDVPSTGGAYWYLVRTVYGSSGNADTYDVEGTGTTRDDGIAASPQACP